MENRYKNILVAIDGSKGSKIALNKAIDITKRDGATIHLVHIMEHYNFPGDTGSIKKTQEKLGNEVLENNRNLVLNNGITEVNTKLEFGNPKSLIPKKIAKEINADLIVCGATGLNAFERILGSVSENIARYAACDVLIVRNSED
ncbi:universal stress protein [Pseudogracilibacillus sp. SO30301A]|uniref:universal stress protein n=1 Tax=Pseudogracilibacillus sp. SO30301A TaxID=3098291 RepID=UPI00300DE9DA